MSAIASRTSLVCPAAALLLTVRDLTENVHAITRVPNCPGTFFSPPGFNHTRLPVDRDKNGCMQDHVDNWIWSIFWSPGQATFLDLSASLD